MSLQHRKASGGADAGATKSVSDGWWWRISAHTYSAIWALERATSAGPCGVPLRIREWARRADQAVSALAPGSAS